MAVSLYLNGDWKSGSGEGFASQDPVTQEAVWQGNAASPLEVEQAVDGARLAQSTWAWSSIETRESILRAFAKELETRREALSEMISREVGKPRWEAITEVQIMIAKMELTIEAHRKRASEFPGGTAITRFKPHGVIAVLGPFNFPGHLPNGQIAPAILAGNAVVFKPSERAPGVAQLMVECWEAAGLPSGVLQLVQGLRLTGEALVQASAIDGLFFTGSSTTGQSLIETFAKKPGKILAVEMGGNNPLVVHEVENIDAAVLLTILSAYSSAGQRCNCARRLIVPQGDRGDLFLEALISKIPTLRVGHYTERPEPFCGPVITPAMANRLLQEQKEMKSRGGKILVEMKSLRAGTGLLSPGLIEMTDAERRDEEHFGPLLQVIRVPDFDAAIEEANRTEFGLVAGLLSDRRENYDRFYARAKAGIVNWNQPTIAASSAAPFGGVGRSGNHRPAAYFAIDACLYPVASIESETVTVPTNLPPGVG